MKPRLLVIPHIYAEDIAVREIELARRLTSRFDVFVFKWRDAQHAEGRSIFARRWRQGSTALLAALRSRSQSTILDGLQLIEVPMWQPVLLHTVLGNDKASAVCKRLNGRTLRAAIQDLKITHLLLANELFGLERIRGVRAFFDVVDWFPEDLVSANRLAQIRANLQVLSRSVDGIFAVSTALCEKLERELGVRASPLPNGADIARLRSVAPDNVCALRQRLGIANNFAIGYIGNHGSYTGVDLAVNAFLAVRQRIPSAKLLIIGPAETWNELLAAHREQGVIATGRVAPAEIAEYFNAIDIGILAQGKSPGTDFAFQIKVVEYSACRKCVVSTPLLNWQRLAWPNVILAETNAQAWADAFVQARSMSWDPAWDHIVDAYDWQAIADQAAETMIGTN